MKIRRLLLLLSLAAGVCLIAFFTLRPRPSAEDEFFRTKLNALQADPTTRVLLAPVLGTTNQDLLHSEEAFERTYQRRLLAGGISPDEIATKLEFAKADWEGRRTMDAVLGPLTTDRVMRAFIRAGRDDAGAEVHGHLWMLYRLAAVHEKGFRQLETAAP